MTLGVLGAVVYVLCVLLAAGTLAQIAIWAGAIVFSVLRDPYERRRDFAPPVSIVKPVRGLSPGDDENFASYFAIDYPVFEIIFAVHADAGEDPSLPVIRRLIAEHPGVDARLLRTTRRDAVHEKVNNYDEAIEASRYGIINITDADTYVRPDHLSREVRPLSDEGIGMSFSVQTVTHFRSPATAFEGLVQSADYPLFLRFAAVLGLTRWVVGHSILFRKADYLALNAFSVLKDHLIDDIGWGEVFCGRAGRRIWLSKYVTHTRAASVSWKKVADHIVRWGLFFYSFTHGYLTIPLIENTSIGLITLVLSLFLAPGVPAPFPGVPLRALGIAMGAGTILWRTASNVIGTLLYSDTPGDLRYFWTIPLRDAFTLWVAGAVPFTRSFTQAGVRYRIRGRRIERVVSP
jgi:ceramide glucosyltransferase